MTRLVMEVANFVLIISLRPLGILFHNSWLIRNRLEQSLKLCALDLVIKQYIHFSEILFAKLLEVSVSFSGHIGISLMK